MRRIALPLRRTIALLALALPPAACAHQQRPAGSPDSRLVINADELRKSRAGNAYEAIVRLRAEFLSNRGETSLTGTSSSAPTVYVDDAMFGPVAELRRIPVSQIAQIRMYRSWEAATRYGSGNMGGVIAIYTKLPSAVEAAQEP